MAKRFVCLDLSDTARDFFPIAVEPGVAMLDDSNAHNRILCRWLGSIAVEPVWEGDSVSFFVRDDQGGRLEEAVCQPVIAADLTGVLKEDFAALRDRIEKARPETATERALHKCIQRWLKDLLEDPNRTDHDCYFFRYRDASGCWRLVWCWGFQRRDQELAPAVICTDPECSLLFVRRPNQSHRCPRCEAALPPRSKRKSHKSGLAAALVLLILAVGLGWWWAHRPRLTVAPTNLNLIEGEVADLKIDATNRDEPVTIKSDDSAVDVMGTNRLIGRKEGSARVEVAQGNLKAAVSVTVEKGEILSIALAPAKLVVPVDDTIEPRVVAQVRTKNGKRQAEIAAGRLTCEKQPSPQFAQFGATTMKLMGISPTNPQSPQTLTLRLDKHQASAPVEVVVPPLQLTLEPPGPIDLPAGQMRGLQVVAEYKSGRKVEIPPHLVQWHAVSSEKATPGLELRDGKIVALKPDAGPLPVYATYYGNESNRVIFKSVEAEAVTLQLKSAQKEHRPGDTGEVIVTGTTSHGEVELVPDLGSFKSSEDKILAIDAKSGAYRAITPGEATIDATHAAAKDPATLKLMVLEPLSKQPEGKRPKSVKIVSRQGMSVQLPVGAEFNDFSIEAEYPDGTTRTVTNESTLTVPEPPQKSPVAVSNGRLVGVRAGRTSVKAEFDGIAAEQPLAVEVTDKLDIDEIRLTPDAAKLPRGETISMAVVGYKNGKSVGDITGRPGVVWQSSKPEIVQTNGPTLTAASLGQSSITAKLGSIVSQPVKVDVVDPAAPAESLAVKPETIRLHVGESVRLGADVSIMRGKVDVSGQAEVTPGSEDVVRYAPESRSLVGVSPGQSSVSVAVGKELIDVPVEVLPAPSAKQVVGGKVVVEPAAANLALGQSQALRVYLVTPGGERIDRTESAVLESSDPAKVRTVGDQVWATAPGTAEITAKLPGVEKPGLASVTVGEDKIVALRAEPSPLDMAVGEKTQLHIYGVTAGGTHVLFPQKDLKIAVVGDDPKAKVVRITPSGEVAAVKLGEGAVHVAWHDKLNADVPVTVTDKPLADLQIEPAQAAIRRGQLLGYQVSALKGNRRVLLRPKDGVELFVGSEDVAQAIEKSLAVRGKALGRTSVFAKLGEQQAEANLDVVERKYVQPENVRPGYVRPDRVERARGSLGRRGIIINGRRVFATRPECLASNDPQTCLKCHSSWDLGMFGDHDLLAGRDDGIYGHDGTTIGGGGGRMIPGAPIAPAHGLRFVQDLLRMEVKSTPCSVRVVEVRADGSDGRDVTLDPNLHVDVVGPAASVKKSINGPVFHPLKIGQSQAAAKLGPLETQNRLLIVVGDGGDEFGSLVASPTPLTIWAGETYAFDSVQFHPGGRHLALPIDYRLSLLSGQGVVELVDDNKLRGKVPGTAQVIVTSVDPTGRHAEATTVVAVHVVAADRLSIQPSPIVLQVGQHTPPLTVTVQGGRNLSRQVEASEVTLESMDPKILALDPRTPDQFVARISGATQVRARYHGTEALADVKVSGKRFTSVVKELNRGARDFCVGVTIRADAAEGPLEYRIYVDGCAEAEKGDWKAAAVVNGAHEVKVVSPQIAYGSLPFDTLYRLMIDARSTKDGSIECYPLTFRLEPVIK
ncbi:MAG: hypothetical protein WCB27_26250 [Thermoguttaceae bacterium]|jgi:hypothetical protein